MNEQSGRARDLKEVGKSAVSTVLDRVGRGMGKVQERTPLPYDLLESDDAYLVVFDAPGATRSDIQVRFHEGAVEVRVDRFRDFREGFEMRFPGRGLALDGRAKLPAHASVDARGAEATLTDEGTLRVRLPRTERESATSVTIEDESGVDDESDATEGDAEDEYEKPVGEAVSMGEAEDEAETLEDPEDDVEADEYDSPDEYEESTDGESDDEK